MESEVGGGVGEGLRVKPMAEAKLGEVIVLAEDLRDCTLAVSHKILGDLLSFLVPQFPHLTSQEVVGRPLIWRDS